MNDIAFRVARVIDDLAYLVQLPGREVAQELENSTEIMGAILDCYICTRGLNVTPTRPATRPDNPVR